MAAAQSADLCLALGTSLRGTTPDTVPSLLFHFSHSLRSGLAFQVATLPAERSLVGEALGTAIVSLQQTPEDGVATLRIFCCLERFLSLLLRVLNLELPPPTYERELALRVSHCARVPYDGRGWRSTSVTSLMNLAPGQLVKLHENHNWKSCGQRRGEQISGDIPEGRVVRYSPGQRAWELEVGGIAMLIGYWWMEGAVRGDLLHHRHRLVSFPNHVVMTTNRCR